MHSNGILCRTIEAGNRGMQADGVQDPCKFQGACKFQEASEPLSVSRSSNQTQPLKNYI